MIGVKVQLYRPQCSPERRLKMAVKKLFPVSCQWTDAFLELILWTREPGVDLEDLAATFMTDLVSRISDPTGFVWQWIGFAYTTDLAGHVRVHTLCARWTAMGTRSFPMITRWKSFCVPLPYWDAIGNELHLLDSPTEAPDERHCQQG
jgi:hypothetical protein